jgi:hypothetical protein
MTCVSVANGTTEALSHSGQRSGTSTTVVDCGADGSGGMAEIVGTYKLTNC